MTITRETLRTDDVVCPPAVDMAVEQQNKVIDEAPAASLRPMRKLATAIK